MSQMRTILFVTILMLTAFIGVIVFGVGFLPIVIFSPSIFRRFFSYMIGLWEIQVAALMEYFLGIKFCIEGEIRPDEQCVIIMNHRTCLDWMYFWSLLARQSKIRKEKVVLKSPLKHIPGAGWAMQMAGFMFLDRKWEIDQPYLQTMLNSFFSMDYKAQILLFPEGTDLSSWAIEKSNSFADKNNLPRYKYLLHPRVTGLGFIYEEMRKKWNTTPIYDVTISYPSDFPQNERELIHGKFPNTVHFKIRRFDATELPSNCEQVGIWCQNLWLKKEKQLEQFYTDTNALTLNKTSQPDINLHLEYISALLFWFVSTITFIYILVTSFTFFIYVSLVTFFYLVMGYFNNGFELFLAQYSIRKSHFHVE